MDAVVFDFDGVIIDSEPTHLACFQRVLAAAGIRLTREQYYGEYLGLSDRDCFSAALAEAGRRVSDERLMRMVAAKSELVVQAFAAGVRPLDGAVELVTAAAGAGAAVGICSGALLADIRSGAAGLGVLEHVAAIVAGDDVAGGKPDPEGYLLALERLSEASGRELSAARSVAVEDSPMGIAAARAAGMKVLAVTNSYEARKLGGADRVVDSLVGLTPVSLDELL